MHKKFKVHPSLPSRYFIHFGLLDDGCWGM